MNKKFTTLTTLLALGEIELNAGFFGNKKPFAKFDEDQLQVIEDALQKTDNTDLEKKVTDLEAEKIALEKSIFDQKAYQLKIENALEQALQINGLEPASNIDGSIALLGEKCKEYGDADVSHTLLLNDGHENPDPENSLQDGYYDPKAPHNQLD